MVVKGYFSNALLVQSLCLHANIRESKISVMTAIEVVSISLNVILLIVGVGLAVNSWKDSQKKKDQVKVWMEQANGISQALQRIIQDKWSNLYTSVSDVTNTINAVHASAFALYQSLYDERFLTEKETKEHQMKIRAKIDKDLELAESAQKQAIQETD